MSGKSRISVEVINGDIGRALKTLKNKFIESGMQQELRDRKEFVKPSVSKRKMKKTAIYNQKQRSIRDID